MRFDPDLISALRNARHVVVLTGSGTSAESGIPTFREAQTGLWEMYRPEDLATPDAFERNPQLVLNWYAWRRELVSSAEPNEAHRAIAKLEKLTNKLTLITQNVDGLHQRAGSTDVIEFHGSVLRSRCSEGHKTESLPDSSEAQPRCELCDSLLRPDVVWFGESIPEEALARSFKAIEDCDVFLAVGTSAEVQPAASLATMAQHHGAVLVEVNPSATPLTDTADYALAGSSGTILPELITALEQHV
ncbi:MAG: NAD-dependent deacylase [Gammaproteobacteria bacterium]|jgi:NAD-dependent deacetylase|nr:NAD-dependent deacylase [Gammaproteobacteria bacterium]